MKRSRAAGTNLRALGLSPRQLAPRAKSSRQKANSVSAFFMERAKDQRSGLERRNGVPRWLRFEILKRDGFACQYCGAKAPKVWLHVDHVTPKSKGGETVPSNLLTACEDCNGGKDARLLSESLL